MTRNNYDLLKETYDIVNRLEEKVDKRLEDIEARVGVLESFKGRVLGVAAIMSAIISVAGTWLWRRIVGS